MSVLEMVGGEGVLAVVRWRVGGTRLFSFQSRVVVARVVMGVVMRVVRKLARRVAMGVTMRVIARDWY